MKQADKKIAFFVVNGAPKSMTMTGFSEGYTIGEFIDFIRHCFPKARDIEIKDCK